MGRTNGAAQSSSDQQIICIYPIQFNCTYFISFFIGLLYFYTHTTNCIPKISIVKKKSLDLYKMAESKEALKIEDLR